MGSMASQITSLTIVYLTVYSGADQRKNQSSASPVPGEFPAQRASNAENASIAEHRTPFIIDDTVVIPVIPMTELNTLRQDGRHFFADDMFLRIHVSHIILLNTRMPTHWFSWSRDQ